jgi:hypothetical protein
LAVWQKANLVCLSNYLESCEKSMGIQITGLGPYHDLR